MLIWDLRSKTAINSIVCQKDKGMTTTLSYTTGLSTIEPANTVEDSVISNAINSSLHHGALVVGSESGSISIYDLRFASRYVLDDSYAKHQILKCYFLIQTCRHPMSREQFSC